MKDQSRNRGIYHHCAEFIVPREADNRSSDELGLIDDDEVTKYKPPTDTDGPINEDNNFRDVWTLNIILTAEHQSLFCMPKQSYCWQR